jgi:hypothetical protein
VVAEQGLKAQQAAAVLRARLDPQVECLAVMVQVHKVVAVRAVVRGR